MGAYPPNLPYRPSDRTNIIEHISPLMWIAEVDENPSSKPVIAIMYPRASYRIGFDQIGPHGQGSRY